MKYLKFLKKTLETVKTHPYRFISSFMLDSILLSIVLGFLYYTFASVQPHLEVMVTAISRGLQEPGPEFMASYSVVFRTVSLFLLTLFVAYVLIKGTNWRLLTLKKSRYWKYILNFCISSLIFAMLSFIIISTYLNLVFSISPILQINVATFLMYICLLLISYFAAISYVLIDNSLMEGIKAFAIGVKRSLTLAPNFIIISILILILKKMIDSYPKSAVLFLVFIIFPAIAFNRYFIKEAI